MPMGLIRFKDILLFDPEKILLVKKLARTKSSNNYDVRIYYGTSEKFQVEDFEFFKSETANEFFDFLSSFVVKPEPK